MQCPEVGGAVFGICISPSPSATPPGGRPPRPLLRRRRPDRDAYTARAGDNSVGRVIDCLLRSDLITMSSDSSRTTPPVARLLFRFVAAAHECRSWASPAARPSTSGAAYCPPRPALSRWSCACCITPLWSSPRAIRSGSARRAPGEEGCRLTGTEPPQSQRRAGSSRYRPPRTRPLRPPQRLGFRAPHPSTEPHADLDQNQRTLSWTLNTRAVFANRIAREPDTTKTLGKPSHDRSGTRGIGPGALRPNTILRLLMEQFQAAGALKGTKPRNIKLPGRPPVHEPTADWS